MATTSEQNETAVHPTTFQETVAFNSVLEELLLLSSDQGQTANKAVFQRFMTEFLEKRDQTSRLQMQLEHERELRVVLMAERSRAEETHFRHETAMKEIVEKMQDQQLQFLLLQQQQQQQQQQ